MFYNNSFHVKSISLMNSQNEDTRVAVSERVFVKFNHNLLNGVLNNNYVIVFWCMSGSRA